MKILPGMDNAADRTSLMALGPIYPDDMPAVTRQTVRPGGYQPTASQDQIDRAPLPSLGCADARHRHGAEPLRHRSRPQPGEFPAAHAAVVPGARCVRVS